MRKVFLISLILSFCTIMVFAQAPRITSPSDRSSSTLGNDINVIVSGNNIEVIYAGLNGTPNPSNENESSFYKGNMYQSGSRFFFTPNTSTWENKWVKIIAHDKNRNLWSAPVYVQVKPKSQPTPMPPTQPTYTTQPVNINSFKPNKPEYSTSENVVFSGSATNFSSWKIVWLKNGSEADALTGIQHNSNIYVSGTVNSTAYNGAVLYVYPQANGGGTPKTQRVSFTVVNPQKSEINLTKAEWQVGKGVYVEGNYKLISEIWECHCKGNNCWNTKVQKFLNVDGSRFWGTIPAIHFDEGAAYQIYVAGTDNGQETQSVKKTVDIPVNSSITLTKAEWQSGKGIYVEGTYKWLDYLWEVHCIGSNCDPTFKNQYFSFSDNKFSATIPASIYQEGKEYKIYVVGLNKNTGQELKSEIKSVNIPKTIVPPTSNNLENSPSNSNSRNNSSSNSNNSSINLSSFAKGTYDRSLYNDRISYRTDGWKIAHAHQGGNWTLATDFWYQIYVKGDNVIIAFRGTPAPLKDTNDKFIFTTIGNWKETLELIGLFGNKAGSHPQDKSVQKEVDAGEIFKYLKADKRIYITGHSLGGHLAMICYKQILYKGYGYLVDGVETFNAVGISKSDADFINKNGNYNKITQYYACCDIARWASEANGLAFPGKPQKNPISHKDVDSHAKLTYEQSIEKIKYLASLVLSGKINSYEYEIMGDVMISELTIRATSHGVY